MTCYPTTMEHRMRRMFLTLNEKDRRRYASVEADKLGHGGIGYIARLFGIDPKTIKAGRDDLDAILDPAGDRIRRPGGGRHKKAT